MCCIHQHKLHFLFLGLRQKLILLYIYIKHFMTEWSLKDEKIYRKSTIHSNPFRTCVKMNGCWGMIQDIFPCTHLLKTFSCFTYELNHLLRTIIVARIQKCWIVICLGIQIKNLFPSCLTKSYYAKQFCSS